MRFGIALFAAVLVLALLQGCNSMMGQPHFKETRILPEAVQPGEQVIIQVVVKDKKGVIAQIKGTVLEDTNITFPLRDDGEGADEKAGDGVWTWAREIPFQAPPGEYHFEFTAFRDDGIPVQIRTKEGEVITLQSERAMRIRFEESAAS